MDTKIQEALLKTIETLINKKNKNLAYDYHVDAKITAVNSNDFDCLINGETYKIKARAGLSLSVGNLVSVLVINGDFSNKIIDFKRP